METFKQTVVFITESNLAQIRLVLVERIPVFNATIEDTILHLIKKSLVRLYVLKT